jgi:sodium-dependent dicarboxylate transporter 2/3/5
MSEAMPLPATSLLPLVLFPVLGILNYSKTSSAYINNIIFLFLGGFFIAIAIENWNLHKRISLIILNLIGGSLPRILFATMLAACFLSMLINNTSTAMMMLPIGLSLILELESAYPDRDVKNFGLAMMLGIAYSSSIGGIATLVGTVPNLVFVRIFEINFPNAPEISFGKWMLFGFPISIIMLISVWYILNVLLLRKLHGIKIDKSFIAEEKKRLSTISYEEKILLVLLPILCFLWIFRIDLDLGGFIIYGWSNLFPWGKAIDDSTIAIFMALLMFVIPSKTKKGRLLELNSFKQIPWDVIILFGGGFALADAFQGSGLSSVISKGFTAYSWLPPILIVALVCTILTFLTELTSNTATTQTVLPIFASAAVALQINPLFLMIPATISASFAFMLPVGTPPNAIVFGTGRVRIGQMARTGLIINFIGIIIVTLMFYFLGTLVFGVDINTFPDWGVKR